MTGSVRYTYDADFRVAASGVNDLPAVSYGYDADGILTGVGDLLLDRDMGNGRLLGSALGLAQTQMGYNAFGEVESSTGSVDGVSVYTVTYGRDRLGRIIARRETIEGVTQTSATLSTRKIGGWAAGSTAR